ncbi:MAG TPA: hypothetical protein VH306_07860 [Gaiellaceae bacterium]|jgi:hypothetical protein
MTSLNDEEIRTGSVETFAQAGQTAADADLDDSDTDGTDDSDSADPGGGDDTDDSDSTDPDTGPADSTA